MAYIQDWGMRVQAQPQINTTRRAFLHLSQNENGRMLNIRITDVNIPSGSTAVLAGTKPDGTVYSQAGTLAGNTATFAEDVQMTAVVGTWDAKITVTNGGNCICTARITITIDPDTVAGGAVPSDSQLDGIIAECRAIADSVRKEAYGSPLVADAVEDMTDQSRVYVYTGSESGMTAGHWYYYNGSTWTDGGVYNAVAVDTDTTLTIAGKAADAKEVGDQLTSVKEDFNALLEVESNIVAQDAISETLSANAEKTVRLPYEYLQGKAYEITVTLNEVHWKNNGTQFVRIGAYSANSVSSSYLVEFIRLDTDAVSKETLTIRYVPSTDTVKMIGFVFYLGSGSQDIDVTISEINSEIVNNVNNLKNISQYVLPLVDVSEKQFDGSMTSATSVLYFPYNFYTGNKYKLSFECVIGTETVTNCLRVHTATAQNVSDNYKKDIINAGASASPLCGTINDFSTGNTIEEEFTANNDASCLIVVYYGSLNSNYQINVTIARISSVESLDKEVLSKNIVSLNRDVEPYVLQLGREISPQTQNHNYKRLNFIFFSDIHAKADLWERVCDYMDEYSDIIPFAIHGGDYVSTDLRESSVVDLYGLRKPNSGAILNTVGNHDCYPSGQTSPTAPIADTYNVLYSSADPANDGWDCVFGTEQYSMYWYKDITDAQIRIICIDQYHWTEAQAAFITNAFADAITNNYAVVTVTHTPITTAVDNIGSGFWTLDDWTLNDTYSGSMIDIRATITTFINNGGTHLVNLCGHIHSDQIGTLSTDGIFQIRTQTAGDNGLWTDTVRAVGTKTYDCFNVIQIDRNLGMIKLVRVGNNTSDCLQARTTLCFDYVNKRLISNN